MIGRVLAFLREHLNAYLMETMAEGEEETDSVEDRVVFLDGDKLEPLSFKQGAVTELLINLEEERQLRAPDLHLRRIDETEPGGAPRRVQPDIRLVLYVLFVARFRHYDVAWDHLSTIIERFQSLRFFDRAQWPALPTGVDRLVLELVPLDIAKQNEVWNSLRITQHPSVLYRVKLVTFHDRQASTPPQVGTPPERRLSLSDSNSETSNTGT